MSKVVTLSDGNIFKKYGLVEIEYVGHVDTLPLTTYNLALLNKILESKETINHMSRNKTTVVHYKNYMANDFSYLNIIDSLKSYIQKKEKVFKETSLIMIYNEPQKIEKLETSAHELHSSCDISPSEG